MKKYCLHNSIEEQKKPNLHIHWKKTLEKQTRTIEEHSETQVQAINSLKSPDRESPSIKKFISERMLNPEIMKELEKIGEQKEKLTGKTYFAKETKLNIIL